MSQACLAERSPIASSEILAARRDLCRGMHVLAMMATTIRLAAFWKVDWLVGPDGKS